MHAQVPSGDETRGTGLDRFPALGEMGAFAASLRSLTNYEVWERTESTMLQLAPVPDSTPQDWLRFEALLDELRWRLSGLEGAGSPVPQLSVSVMAGRGQ